MSIGQEVGLGGGAVRTFSGPYNDSAQQYNKKCVTLSICPNPQNVPAQRVILDKIIQEARGFQDVTRLY